MTEKEYRLNVFEKGIEKYIGKKIVLYGTAANAKAMVERFDKKLCFLGLMGNSNVQYLYGKKILSKGEVLELQTEVIVIAAQITSTEIVYHRMLEFCVANHIELVDMYGNHTVELHQKVALQKIHYFDKNLEQCKKQIAKYDVVSFDLMDTFVMRKVWNTQDIFKMMEDEMPEGICVEDFVSARRKAQEDVGSCYSLEEVYLKFQQTEKLPKKDIQQLMQLEIKKELENVFVRQEMMELYHYALKSGKNIVFVSDWLIPGSQQKEVLEKAGVCIYNAFYKEDNVTGKKTNGLFRMMAEQYKHKRILHIGDDSVNDWIAPLMYGIDTYVLYSPFDTLQVSDCRIQQEEIICTEHRRILGKALVSAFSNPFVLYQTKGKAWLGTEDRRRISKIQMPGREDGIAYCPVLLKGRGNHASWREYQSLEFTHYDHPLVSIIIPVYNQFDYTYLCLQSVLEHTGQISYEIIVADDCSMDDVKNIENVVKGIKVIHHNCNMKFLKNCNSAAKQASGKYLLFLNNDTQVQPGWLKPLLDLMEHDEQIGLAGSKLVYPDGRLQEAGGILWKDASAWNYGNQQDPDRSEYNYVKDVDYISGASMIIRTELWKDIGGFDEQFAPAYCEDSDLAFEVRKRGKRVVYQPQSVVVHFEGISNGTDTGNGIKAYQKINNQKFFRKWRDVLEKDHFENGTHILLARDKSKYKKHILVIDHYVPTYDMDAGNKTSFMYLELFVKMGMQVTFLGDNFNKMEPYGSIVNQMGIEVLYGRYYYENWESWMAVNLKYFDYVYMQRPDIAVKYIDVVRMYSNAKILYYAHDLHFLRELRQYELEKKPEHLQASERYKKLEYELFKKADVGYVVSPQEEKIMKQILPHKVIRSIPGYLYDKQPKNINKDFRTRKDILFVGGFGHTPNIDGVLWFAKEVFPNLLSRYPEMKWHIVGNHVPETIYSLAGSNIIVEGFLSDEELRKLYVHCRLAVAPLRYGAGVKGKVVEAAYYQIPMVTTTIGAEGLERQSGAFVVEDDPIAMAELISKLYQDYDNLRRMSDHCEEYIKTNFTSAVAEHILGQDIEFRQTDGGEKSICGN